MMCAEKCTGSLKPAETDSTSLGFTLPTSSLTSPLPHLHHLAPRTELELDPFTLEIEPVEVLAPLGGPPNWHDAATEISIEELFEVPPWPISPEQSSSDNEMAEDLVVNITLLCSSDSVTWLILSRSLEWKALTDS
jgi:hypothetical protein